MVCDSLLVFGGAGKLGPSCGHVCLESGDDEGVVFHRGYSR